jgi:HAD superfamily hydrolase (TIGR01549 family)
VRDNSLLKTALFDLDDTLFDHRHSARVALGLLKERYQDKFSNISLDELERIHLEILNEIHVDVLKGTITIEDARIRRFAMLSSRYDLLLSEEEQHEASSLYRTVYQSSRRAAVGSLDLLQALRLRGIRIGIVTNNLVEEQLDKIQHCGLAPFIDSITISEEAGVSKPHSRIFQIALERLHSTSDGAVMIGDSWTSDILGARAAGIRAVWYNCYGKRAPVKENAPVEAEQVPELRSFEDLDYSLQCILAG